MKHIQIELDFIEASTDRLVKAVERLIQQHEALQSYRGSDGGLINANANAPISVIDAVHLSAAQVKQHQQQLRNSDYNLDANTWPWYKVTIIKETHQCRAVFSLAKNMLDERSVFILLRELQAYYQHPDIQLQSPPLEMPEFNTTVNDFGFSLSYRHEVGRMDHQALTQLRAKCDEHQIALPVVITYSFLDNLKQIDYQYPVYLTLANRFPFYPFLYDKACFATTTAITALPQLTEQGLYADCQALVQQFQQQSIYSVEADYLFSQIPDSTIDKVALFSCNFEQDLPSGPMFAKLPNIAFCNINLVTIDVDLNVWLQAGQLMYRWSFAKAVPIIDSHAEEVVLAKALHQFPELRQLQQNNEDAAAKNKGKTIKLAPLIFAGSAAQAGIARARSRDINTMKALSIPINTLSQLHQAAQHNSLMHDTFKTLGQSLYTLASSPKNLAQQVTTLQSPLNQLSNDSNAPSKSVTPSRGAGATAGSGFNKPEHQNHSNDSNASSDNKPNNSGAGSSAAGSGASGSATAGSGAAGAAAAGSGAAGAAAAGSALGKAISDLSRAANKPKPPMPTPPSAEDISGQSADKIKTAFDAYAQQMAGIHQLPTDANSAKQNVENQLANSGGNTGSSLSKYQDQLNSMSQLIDSIGNNIASGNLTAAQQDIGALTKQHVEFHASAKANGHDSISNDPLVKSSNDIYQAAIAISNGQDPDSVNLGDKLNDFNQKVSDVQSNMQQGSSAELAKAQQQQTEKANQAISASPEYAVMQAKTQQVSDTANKVSQMSCSDLAKPHNIAHIKALEQHTADLANSIPTPSTTIDQHVQEAQASVQAITDRANALQNASPAQVAADGQLQSAMGKLHSATQSMQKKVIGSCPVCTGDCSTKAPELPNVPSPNAVSNINPLHVPTINLSGALSALQSTSSTSLSIPPLVSQLQSSVEQLKSGSVSPDVSNVANPYDTLTNALTSNTQQVQSMTSQLSSCDCAHMDDNVKQSLMNSQNNLSSATDQITTLKQNNPTQNTLQNLQSLQGQMQSLVSNQSTPSAQAIAMQAAPSMGNVSNTVVHWQGMNVPSPAGGMPDEILVSGFKCMCPAAIGPPASVVTPPSQMQIDNKFVLLIDGVPLTANMGQCTQVSKTTPTPCVSTLMVAGGSTASNYTGMPVATKSKSKLMCPLGSEMIILDTGQNHSEPVTTP